MHIVRDLSKHEKLLEFISISRADLVHVVLGRERLTLKENREFQKECAYRLMDIYIEKEN